MKTLSPETLLVASVTIALVPLLVAVGSCYLKFSVVLSLLKSGFGTQQAPSSALVMGLSVVMSLIVMQPVVESIIARSNHTPMPDPGSRDLQKLLHEATLILEPWRVFLVSHSGEHELTVFSQMTTGHSPAHAESGPRVVDGSQVSLITALAAFVLSEIKKGFTMGFFLLLPFFVIDLVTANILVALGLTMMSPVIISLPIKILLFISADGWLLLARTMIEAYR